MNFSDYTKISSEEERNYINQLEDPDEVLDEDPYFSKVHPLDFYYVLKDKFGEPSEVVEDIFGYIWKTKSSVVSLEYYRGVTTGYFELYGYGKSAQNDIYRLVDLIEYEAARMRKRGEINFDSSFKLMIRNPYSLYFKQGGKLLELHEFMRLSQNKFFKQSREILEEKREDQDKKRDIGERDRYEILPANLLDPYVCHSLLNSAFFMFIASFEGFMNLIYEIYTDATLQKDSRLNQHIQRLHIDIKVRSAPIYCVCFDRKVLEPDERFKKFQAVVNLRNDFIHANITQSMKSEIHNVDEFDFFQLDRLKLKPKFGLPANPSQLNYENVLFVAEVVEDMVQFLLESMNIRYRRELEKVLERDVIALKFVKGEYVIDPNYW